MRASPYAFYAPTSLADAFELLDRYEEEAKVLAGGMSMMPAMNLGLLRPAAIVSLNHLSGLDEIREDDGVLVIGALATHAQVAASDTVQRLFPLLATAASLIGDVQVRNRGTIGGSLVHADPAGDYLASVVALDAVLVLKSSDGVRTVNARDFLVGVMRTSIAPTEILVEIRIPMLPDGARTAYKRFARLEGSFAIIAAAAVATDETVRVVLAGVASQPLVLEQPAAGLGAGEDEAYAALGAAVDDTSSDAYGDLAGDAGYRREMARIFAARTVRAAFGHN